MIDDTQLQHYCSHGASVVAKLRQMLGLKPALLLPDIFFRKLRFEKIRLY
jgi:hypothetical protein